MNKNIVQEKRMRNYFIQAAMEILRGEGIRDLSVRHVAEKAGYSYATLYNYFKDLDNLLTACINEFLIENESIIQESIKYIPNGKQRLSLIYYTYIKYFIQYPGIFDLIYQTKLKSSEARNLILTFLDRLCQEDWNYIQSERIYDENEVKIKQETAKLLIIGSLLTYNNLHYPADFEQFQQTIKTQFSNLLEI
jgi:AcrR family transcriptional regulator